MSLEKHLPFSGKNYKVISKELEYSKKWRVGANNLICHTYVQISHMFHPSLIIQFETSAQSQVNTFIRKNKNVINIYIYIIYLYIYTYISIFISISIYHLYLYLYIYIYIYQKLKRRWINLKKRKGTLRSAEGSPKYLVEGWLSAQGVKK